MEIVNQPFKQSLGFRLIEKIQSGHFSVFHFMVAYAKTSGVNRLLPYMRQFKENGGTIKAVVGIDQGNISYEALISLLSVCNELYIYHSEDFMRTFHVKAYHLGKSDENWIAIGSNNFTAGGLFSNYEASMASAVDEEQTNDFMDMFRRYSDIESPCCKLGAQEFVDELLTNGYIQHEKSLAKHSIDAVKRSRARQKETILFGKDNFLGLPSVPDGAPTPSSTLRATPPPATTAPASPTPIPAVEGVEDTDMDYLVRHVPKAGDRSQQVHFTMDILKNYFKLSPGNELQLQQIHDIYTPHGIENRRVVYSARNKNVKIEVSAAEILNTAYPIDKGKRPILIFKRVNPTLFEYMLLMEGNPGYEELNKRLLGLDWHHKSLRYEVIDADTMLTLWEDCPLI